jgi:hypothetical protein
MANPKTMTVNQLGKQINKQIAAGNGRLQVCIDKPSFRHNCEDDGVVILPLDGIRAQSVLLYDDDGGTKTNSRGEECYRRTAVLYGYGGCSFQSIISEKEVDEHVKHWTDIDKLSPGDAVRLYAKYLRQYVS